MNVRRMLWVLAGMGSVAVAGCRVNADKNGDSNNVKIATPFGGMQVKTNDAAVQSGTGLQDYPGATRVKKDKDGGAADVNMSFGSFQLRVKAASYRTTDPPEKVQDFYRKELGRFGDVIQCSDSRPVGTPTQTSEGLTCDKDRHQQISVDDDLPKKFELKAGSPQHQHIVAIETEGSGTKFGLIALDLPGHFSMGDKHESSQ